MGNCNIIPIVALKHRRNTLVTIDVPPSISIIDAIVVSAWDGRVDTTESDCGSMDMHCGGMGAMGPLEGTLERREREPIC